MSGAAYADRVGGGAGAGNDSVEVGGTRGGSAPGTPPRGTGGGNHGGSVTTTTAPGYDQCADMSPANPLYNACMNEFSVGTLQFFPQPGAPAVPPAVLAQQTAADFFKRIPLPTPQPKMSAPSGIAGASHQLDMQTPSAVSFSEAGTAFGELQVSARARFAVDWGDGTSDSYTTAGGPWPSSPVSHSWSKRGSYTVIVTAYWSAHWQLGGFSGDVGGLSTSGSIPNFEVGEIQATLNVNV